MPNRARLYGQNRANRVAHHLFGHVADEQPLDARAAVGRKHDQVDPVTFSGFQYFVEGIAAADKVANLRQVLDSNKLSQKYWIDFFTALVIDRTWDSLSK